MWQSAASQCSRRSAWSTPFESRTWAAALPAGWDLADLLTHMTAQHRGFAAAARGSGADPAIWQPEAVVAAIRTDPAGTYAAAAHDVLDAFAADDSEATFALPDFGPGATFPGTMAMGFHFVDYVVHGWDVTGRRSTTRGWGSRLP